MSTISGVSPSLGANSLYGTSGSSAGSFVDASEVALTEASTEVTQASVSLSADLGGVTAGTAAGELTLQFAQALQNATTVDPGTGQRELASGADAQLTSTFSALLEQNGFSSSQAEAAATSLETQLAQGGEVDLTAAYAQNGSVSASVTSAYGTSAASSISAVDTTQRAGSIQIGIDLATGELSVNLTSQNISSYQAQGQISGSGSLSGPVAQALTLPGQSAQSAGSVLSASGSSALAILSQDLGAALPSLGTGLGIGTDSNGSASPLSESGSEVSVLAESVSATLIDIGSANYAGGSSANGTDGSGAGTGSSGSSLDLSGQQSGAASTATDEAATAALGSQSRTQNTATVLQQVLDALNSARVLGQEEVAGLLQTLAQLSANATANSSSNLATENAAQASSATQAVALEASVTTAGSSAGDGALSFDSGYASISIGIVQTLSVQQLDANGYGSTLYQRPDGSLGRISTSPLSLTA